MAMKGGVGAIVIALIAAFMGGDVGKLLNQFTSGGLGGATSSGRPLTAEEKKVGAFISVVVADTEEVWQKLFSHAGRRYEEPKVVLYRDKVKWAGGTADKGMGPFYSPTDKTVFLDPTFFEELARKLGAPGDFAQAYVIAHEIGHHVQNLLGASGRVHAARRRVSKIAYNRLSVRLELQADFLAGVWAHHMQKKHRFLEEGDIEEALRAATAVGDDTLSRGRAAIESFTHGSARQRVAWFRHGFRTGRLEAGDTFDDKVFRRVDPGPR